MNRYIDLNEVSDGKLYTANDLVKAGCGDCAGCSACCESMADTIILMDAGKIMQQASPEVIYNDPDNVFTAQFVGTPAMNVLPARDGESYLGYRPERAALYREDCTAHYHRSGVILTREMLGSETLYKVQLDRGEAPDSPTPSIMVKSQDFSFRQGEQVLVGVEEKDLYFFDQEKNRVRPKDAAFDRLLAQAAEE